MASDFGGGSTSNPAACPSCGRPTAASRPQCLYCGAALREAEDSTALRTLPQPTPDLAEPSLTLFATNVADAVRTAELVGRDPEDLTALMSVPNPPIARTRTASEADSLAISLRRAGTACEMVADVDFQLNKPNVRISAMRFDAATLVVTNFNTKEPVIVETDAVGLIVEGFVSMSRTDSVSKGRRQSAKTLSETVTTSDEPVLDIYTSSSLIGFRIVPSGFDFSVLGERKRLTAAENWRTLIEMLPEHFPTARVDRDYVRLRRGLDTVWPSEAESAFVGRVISGIGRRDFGSVSSVSNLKQFNIYSRSRRYFV